LTGGAVTGSRRRGPGLRSLRIPALLLAAGVAGWMLHAWRNPEAPPLRPPVVAEVLRCPADTPCAADLTPGPAGSHPGRPHAKAPARPLDLHALPAEGPASDENRREALRAFAQQKAADLRACLGEPGRGPLRRVGAALEIDSHGTVAAVQILGGDTGTRALDSCYSAHLRAWRFPHALLQGDQRLLVNFVL
jgi:hypothetical protein